MKLIRSKLTADNMTNATKVPIELDLGDPAIAQLYGELLRSKLIEEAHEVNKALEDTFDNPHNTNKLVEELGDLYEVIQAIVTHTKLRWDDVETEAWCKRRDKGDFSKCLILPQ